MGLMDSKTFNSLLNERILKTTAVLQSKNKEYGAEDDKLYNFKRTAAMNRVSQAQALWGMASKHFISIIDMVEGKLESTEHNVSEKIGDAINYLILLEAVFTEERSSLKELRKEIDSLIKELPKGLALNNAVSTVKSVYNAPAETGYPKQSNIGPRVQKGQINGRKKNR